MPTTGPSVVGLDLQALTSIDQIEAGRWYRADRVAPLFDLTTQEMSAAARTGEFGPIREHVGHLLIRGKALLDGEAASEVQRQIPHCPDGLPSAKQGLGCPHDLAHPSREPIDTSSENAPRAGATRLENASRKSEHVLQYRSPYLKEKTERNPDVRLFSSEFAAAYLGISVGTLRGIGVPPVKIRGKLLYDRKLLDRWCDEKSGLCEPVCNDDKWLEKLDAGHSSS